MSNIKLSPQTRNRLERIYLLTKTDFQLRYYGSTLGVLWSFINPFFKIIIYYFTFSYLIFRNRDPQFVLYLFTGIISWGFFSEATKTSIFIFQRKRPILENIGLPKVDFFIAQVASKFWGFFINFLIYIVFAIFIFKVTYSWVIIYTIPIFISLYLISLGVSFFLATWYIYLRDLDQIWSIILLAGFWSVPIIWSYDFIYDSYPFMLYNPLTCLLINIRQVTLHNQIPDLKALTYALFCSIAITIAGYYFMKYKSKKAMEFL